jgi:hypothetical protein
MNMGSLYIVYVQYSSQFLSEGIQYLHFLQKKFIGRITSEIVIIDNSLSEVEFNHKLNLNIYPGNNEVREFSGWEAGIQILKKNHPLRNEDVIMICNDSFFRNYHTEWLQLFKGKHFKYCSKREAIIGWQDVFPKKMEILGYSAEKWIRTNCFLINYGLLLKTGIMPSSIPLDELFSDDHDEFFKKDIPLSQYYQRYIKAWLFKNDPEINQIIGAWYRSEPIHAENHEFFQRKAITIICEHALSASAESCGGQIIAINKKIIISRIIRLKRKISGKIYLWLHGPDSKLTAKSN